MWPGGTCMLCQSLPSSSGHIICLPFLKCVLGSIFGSENPGRLGESPCIAIHTHIKYIHASTCKYTHIHTQDTKLSLKFLFRVRKVFVFLPGPHSFHMNYLPKTPRLRLCPTLPPSGAVSWSGSSGQRLQRGSVAWQLHSR